MSVHLTLLLLLSLLLVACDHRTTDSPLAPTVLPPVSNVPPGRPAAPSLFSGQGRALTVGDTVTGMVQESDPKCFPNWDSSSPCQRFTVTPEHAGILTVRAEWLGGATGSFGDLFVVDREGIWVVSDQDTPGEEVRLRVLEGQRYDVLVMSYPPLRTLDFELTADLTSEGAP